MSYRTFKKLMGETSLERKCRFLFGGGLMLLITGSFYFYARLNARLVRDQTTETARQLVVPAMLKTHWDEINKPPKAKSPDKQPPSGEESKSTRSPWLDDPERFFRIDRSVRHHGAVYSVDNSKDRSKRLPEGPDYAVLDAMRDSESPVDEVVQIRKDENGHEVFLFFKGVYAKKSCMGCHYHKEEPYEPGELMGIARISIPMHETNRQLAQNNMVLLAMAIVTAFLAMVAAYLIVRYVIVKPVLHLKDVSDGIARGTLDLRADIRTGDEFEELSHAFNRMLRHLVTIQDELRGVNADLDGKVDELAQVNLQLYEMNKLKDEFLATMSHELRTPLNSILGFSEILAGAENLNEKQKRYLKNIHTSGEELMAHINDVLDLAKIESGKMERQPVEFELDDLVERQVHALSPLAGQKNIDLGYEVDDSIPTLYQDSGKIQQILTNLLSNAIKFTPEGGRVRVTGELLPKNPDEFVLLVEDTGVGIPLEEQGAIFEKFRQGRLIPGQESTMTRKYEGTGLGLSIVKELAKLLDGEVSLESEFGKGSTFLLRLPVRLTEKDEEVEQVVGPSPAAEDEQTTLRTPATSTAADDEDLGSPGATAQTNDPAA